MKKLKLHEVETKLLSLDKKIFTTGDLMAIFGAKKRASEAFIDYNIGKGVFIRLKKGLFAIARDFPGDFYLANNLYYPSYVSLDTVLSYYGLIPESVYAVTSVTTGPTREFEVQNRTFVYRKIKKQAFTGFITKKIEKKIVYIATPEKALVDFLYFVFLKKRQFNDRLDLGRVDKEKLRTYVELFDNKKFTLFVDDILKSDD